MPRIRWYGPSVVLLLTVLVTMVAGPGIVRSLAYAETEARIQLIQNNLSQSEALQTLSESFTQVAEVVEPSVVHIEILGKQRSRSMRGGRMAPFGQMPEEFRKFFPELEQQAPEERGGDDNFEEYNPQLPVGNGSGWVYDNEGHIITNNHVVANAEKIRVRFRNGDRYDAEVVGTDAKTDIAVLKVQAGSLYPAKLTSKPVKQGEIVFAFGSPFRFEFSMTQGIVSATGRKNLNIIGNGGYENFIQTDAAINPGNSGGPLTNIYGEVVGMNTAIASRTGGFNGLGFAIPTDMVKRIVTQIIEKGSVSRGYLGIMLPSEELSPNLAKSFGFEGESGVLVNDVVPDGPAAKAGLKRGDIVTKINDVPITNIDQLRNVVASFSPNTKIDVTYYRQGQGEQVTSIELAELPTNMIARSNELEDEAAVETETSKGSEMLKKFGLTGLQTFSEELAERYGLKFEPGVLVKSVRSGSVAAIEGLGTRAPMIITHVMGDPVTSVSELAEEISKHDPTAGIRLSIAIWDKESEEYINTYEFLELSSE
ncbi:putative periplasmic serine endoprotease DegP-like precursor [Poriferisphaera corsica]|uniref:Putative periplasmic serine endoprotease DegP-like n=1 Tax=Poriferisphaera corsica TaxID=2528020 RepID=A0A517YQY7_9BACT|nr:trypsin-like peptidase domain-containing protein [Poriferisphaera corsica]QDU32627.1 putative periplasmic serine endoprotease DegP-like precursor [Poriferisphaera corsica]